MSDEHDIVEATSRNEATTLTAPASNPQETSKKVGFLTVFLKKREFGHGYLLSMKNH